MKGYSDSAEVSIHCLKSPNTSIDSSILPEVIAPKGLDAKRQWYLYEQIRPFRPSNLQADFTYPKPKVSKRTTDKSSHPSKSNAASATSMKRKHVETTPPSGSESQVPPKKARKCSACGQTGHNVRFGSNK